ncbi:energy transducer TonB [Brevundimonas sp.]|uniref:energy transducer TonB n=1 Tax=Brevundimonas sp. TaxID=1871086 RepID=UPI002EDA8050
MSHVTMQHEADHGRRLGAIVGVGLVHAILIVGFAFSRQDPPAEPIVPPSFDVLMMRLVPPARPVADEPSAGGAPATASRVHRSFDPPTERVELMAPLVQAPLAALEAGLAPVPAVEHGMGQGGEGTGAGDGVGEALGSGSGRGTGPVLVRGPRGVVMTANVSPASLAALPGSYAVLQCYIRVGRDRLEDCRVKVEHPADSGVGRAALQKAEEFRYRPPSRIGRSRDRFRQTIAVAFPAPPAGLSGAEGGRH